MTPKHGGTSGGRGAIEDGLIPEAHGLSGGIQKFGSAAKTRGIITPTSPSPYPRICCQHLLWDEFTLHTEDKALLIQPTEVGLLKSDQLKKICEKSQHP